MRCCRLLNGAAVHGDRGVVMSRSASRAKSQSLSCGEGIIHQFLGVSPNPLDVVVNTTGRTTRFAHVSSDTKRGDPIGVEAWQGDRMPVMRRSSCR
jgi:hypothetical protein